MCRSIYTDLRNSVVVLLFSLFVIPWPLPSSTSFSPQLFRVFTLLGRKRIFVTSSIRLVLLNLRQRSQVLWSSFIQFRLIYVYSSTDFWIYLSSCPFPSSRFWAISVNWNSFKWMIFFGGSSVVSFHFLQVSSNVVTALLKVIPITTNHNTALLLILSHATLMISKSHMLYHLFNLLICYSKGNSSGKKRGTKQSPIK